MILRSVCCVLLLSMIVSVLAWQTSAQDPIQQKNTLELVSNFGYEWLHYKQGNSEHFIRADQVMAVLETRGGSTIYFPGGHLATDAGISEFKKFKRQNK